MASTQAAAGLRERKKQRTRSTLVDVAARLCLQQGYEKTTVEQIAAEADVSPRTFSRYFPSKEAVVAALMEEIAERIAEALVRQPHEITEHEAMVRAHVEVFRAAGRGQPDAMPFDRVSGMLRIVNSSPTLGLAAFTFRSDGPNRAVVEAMARRMGVSVHHPAVRILFDTWAVLMSAACVDLGSDCDDAELLCDRIESAYAVFAMLWKPWPTRSRPPARAPRQ